ncbi:MAG: aminoglycoside phosphotransferase [Acidimicrobiales bacterium]
MKRTDWDLLPLATREEIEAKTGPVRSAVTVCEGKNSALAAVLRTETGRTFVKGLEIDDPGLVTQARETAIAPYVRGVSPRLLWHVQAHGWDVTGFEYIEGRHADYAVGSGDLVLVSDVMRQLAQIDCPGVPGLKRAESRWRNYVVNPGDATCLAGSALLHTDWNPLNVLIADDRAVLVDWAWPTLGAAWVDPACWIQRLIVAGHGAESAEDLAQQVPAWHTASPAQLDAFAAANARLWDEIATTDPQPFKLRMRTAANAWADHRSTPKMTLVPNPRRERGGVR